jgi:predicted dehydrogenase
VTAPPLKFGLVGAGAISQAYAQALNDSRLARIVAVADVRPDAAQALAEQLGCDRYDDHEPLLERAECDAIVVCTPPASHRDICLRAIDAGVHILCEKPLSIDPGSAKEMVQAAERAGVTLTMSSKFRYVEDVIRAKSIVTSGILGDLILFENTFTSRVDMSSRWNSDPEQSGGGVLIDNGTHSVDLIRYFLGPIAQVHAVEGKRVQTLSVEDTVRIFIRSVGGVMGSIDLSWSLNKELDSFIEIYGSRGTVRIGWKESKYRQTGGTDWVVFGTGYDKISAFRRLSENFCKALRGEEQTLITPEDALASVVAVDAAYEALKRNHWVSVEPRSAPDTAGTGSSDSGSR